MIMTSLILMILLNIIVGACVGLTGIAGFLLPMFYTGFLNMPSTEALALSFSAFLVSGIIGSINFYRAGNLEIRPALVLSDVYKRQPLWDASSVSQWVSCRPFRLKQKTIRLRRQFYG